MPKNKLKEKKIKKLAKYLAGTGKALGLLAQEIIVRNEFDKDDEELMSKIGAQLLYHAKTFTFLY